MIQLHTGEDTEVRRAERDRQYRPRLGRRTGLARETADRRRPLSRLRRRPPFILGATDGRRGQIRGGGTHAVAVSPQRPGLAVSASRRRRVREAARGTAKRQTCQDGRKRTLLRARVFRWKD